MFEQKEDDLEIGEVEGFRSDKLHQFNHQALVMEVLRRCAENGSHEMREGWFNIKEDKHGNITKMYVEDTQEKFSESVKTARSIISCDFDNDAKKNIEKLEGELEKFGDKMLDDQDKWWNGMLQWQRERMSQNGIIIVKGMFNPKLQWWSSLIGKRVEIYRKIFQELNELTKRLDFYKNEEFTG